MTPHAFRKQRWKIGLGVAAALIVVATLVYTNDLIRAIRLDERQKVGLWARAVQNRAELVRQTNAIFRDFETEDQKNIRLWAEANQFLASYDGMGDIHFPSLILTNNTTIPVIIANAEDDILMVNNFSSAQEKDTTFLQEEIQRLRKKNAPVDVSYKVDGIWFKQYLYYDDSRIYSSLKRVIHELGNSFIEETVINAASVPVVFTNAASDSILAFGNIDALTEQGLVEDADLIAEMKKHNHIQVELLPGVPYHIYYMDSQTLAQLRYFPWIFLAIVTAFLLTGYLLFSLARRSEQNLLWVGMSKETAHQLGTPISSLMGWLEILKDKNVPPDILHEMGVDVERLQMVAERFSKIGSSPNLQPGLLSDVARQTMDYLRPRIRSSVTMELLVEEEVPVLLNAALLVWALENILRNSVDASTGKALISISIAKWGNKMVVDITDTGKGIPKNAWKSVFKPGYTTKTRGWGLGLSLSKRIVAQYHKGKIGVKWSEIDKGTTLRLVFPMA